MPYPLALALTLLVEVPGYVVILRFAGLLPGWRAWAAAAGVNLVTHPLVWLVLSRHPGWFGPVEAGACGLEALLLWAWVRRDLALLALAAVATNTASVLAGILMA